MNIVRIGLLAVLLITTGCAWTYPPRDPNIALREPKYTPADIKAMLDAVQPPVSGETEPLQFLHPIRPMAIAPYGTDIMIQVWVKRHPENRALYIQWCSGSHAKKLEGEFESQMQPEQYLVVKVPPGKCPITAAVFGPGNKLMHSRQMIFNVCGSPENPCGEQE